MKSVEIKGGIYLFSEHDNLIDHLTIAIEAVSIGDLRSKITKVNGVFYSKKTPIELTDEACMKYASTLEGRKKAVMKIFKYYKPPIIIAPFAVSFFPTASFNNYDCALIFNHPFKIIKEGKSKSRLLFYDSIDILVPVSEHILTQQHFRLHAILNYFQSLTTPLWNFDEKHETSSNENHLLP